MQLNEPNTRQQALALGAESCGSQGWMLVPMLEEREGENDRTMLETHSWPDHLACSGCCPDAATSTARPKEHSVKVRLTSWGSTGLGRNPTSFTMNHTWV